MSCKGEWKSNYVLHATPQFTMHSTFNANQFSTCFNKRTLSESVWIWMSHTNTVKENTGFVAIVGNFDCCCYCLSCFGYVLWVRMVFIVLLIFIWTRIMEQWKEREGQASQQHVQASFWPTQETFVSSWKSMPRVITYICYVYTHTDSHSCRFVCRGVCVSVAPHGTYCVYVCVQMNSTRGSSGGSSSRSNTVNLVGMNDLPR